MEESVREITFFSEADGSMQPALFCPAQGDGPRPLVVALHTWSYGMAGGGEKFFPGCAKRNWHCIYPEFRGPNWRPEACGSDLVVSDLAGAVAYVKANYPVDDSRVFLVGGSGGGHASLLLAGRHPELWTAAAAWCPISDIAKWHDSCLKVERDKAYSEHIRLACGGDPSKDAAAYGEAMKRSPVTYLAAARGKTIIDIGTGIHDGHTGSVPVSQSIEAFNLLAAGPDRIGEADIEYMVRHEAVPEHLRFDGEDPAYGEHRVLMRRVSGMVRLTIFEGGHDILPGASLGFFDHQRRGAAPVWDSGTVSEGVGGELSR